VPPVDLDQVPDPAKLSEYYCHVCEVMLADRQRAIQLGQELLNK